jgi:hypothetical protein
VRAVVITEHLHPGQLERELGKVEDRREPPVPVLVRTTLPGQLVDVALLGWAHGPNGAPGLYGLVRGLREYAPGFWAEFLWWQSAEDLRVLPSAQPATAT